MSRWHFRGTAHLPEGKALDLPANRPNAQGQLKIVCGPLLRYWGTTPANVWRGSVVYVTDDHASQYDGFPPFVLRDADLGETTIKQFKLHDVFGYSFWRYDFETPLGPQAKPLRYALGTEHEPFTFWVPGADDEMNIMFYSCNGFSLGTDTSTFPASLWTDVLRKHAERPFNVMLGGGDQLYCDSITQYLPAFKKWTHKNLSRKGFHYEPTDKDKEGMEAYYLRSYVDWFGRGYWKGTQGDTHQPKWVEAVATIPMLNIYDDHDVLDGWGTYKDSTMTTPMFLSVGQAAHRYYLLFQLSLSATPDNDPRSRDESWVSTWKNGPYMHYPARSIYARLGKSAAFYGLDCRTERKRDLICTPASYDLMFQRIEKEVSADSNIRHLLLMLGVPIAYPRMVWAEHLMALGVLKPIKWLARHQIVMSGFVNEFDGQVELLDDLGDHWCADTHKPERNKFVLRLQSLAQKLGVRITILAGDVHLCGVGRFQTNPKKHHGPELAKENDPRYMLCPISSAITNTPPPQLLADFMNKRNKLHYLEDTVEDLMPFFPKDVDGSQINNHATLARRNFCVLQVGAKGPLDLSVTLNVERDSTDEAAVTVPYSEIVPPLVIQGAANAQAANAVHRNAVQADDGQPNGAPADDPRANGTQTRPAQGTHAHGNGSINGTHAASNGLSGASQGQPVAAHS